MLACVDHGRTRFREGRGPGKRRCRGIPPVPPEFLIMAGTWTYVRLRGLLLLVGLRGLEVRRLRHDLPPGDRTVMRARPTGLCVGDCGQPGEAAPGRRPGFRWCHPGRGRKASPGHGNRRALTAVRLG